MRPAEARGRRGPALRPSRGPWSDSWSDSWGPSHPSSSIYSSAAVDWAKGAAPCNDGILTVFKATQHVPYIELKLHGDAGDLELFLYKTSNVAGWLSQNKPEPFDVPKETVARVTFLSGTGVPEGGKTVELRVRNMDQNEDEAGTPNMRDGKTNYFIFPGESGQDAEWLVGEKNRYVVKVTFEVDGTANECDPFVLVPHEAL